MYFDRLPVCVCVTCESCLACVSVCVHLAKSVCPSVTSVLSVVVAFDRGHSLGAVADLEGGGESAAAPSFGRRTDAVAVLLISDSCETCTSEYSK